MIASTTEHSTTIGNPKWSYDELRDCLEEFIELYHNRPIKDNSGGQKAAQLFYSWFVAKNMKPKYIVESGIFKGQGTWAFEMASPDSSIISIDPYMDKWGGYRSSKVRYIKEDFSKIDWSFIEDKSHALCFFDDHQNAVQRLLDCHIRGFTTLMFEDNYPEGQGDCLSLKKVLESEEYKIAIGTSVRSFLERVVNRYYEFPPIVKLEKTRWGTSWSEHKTNPPLFSSLLPASLQEYQEGMEQYTWINYVELNSAR